MRESDFRDVLSLEAVEAARQTVRLNKRRAMPRAQPVHPVTHRRVSLSARTWGELTERVAVWRRIGHELATGLLDEAEACERLEALQKGRAVASASADLATVWAAWQATLPPEKAVRAAGAWRDHVAPTFGRLPVVALTDARLRAWEARMLGELAPGTFGWVFGMLRSAVKHAVLAHRVRRVPWADYRPPPPVLVKPPAATGRLEDLVEIVRAATEIDAHDASPGKHHRPSLVPDLARRIVVVALVGLRNGEGAGLGWDHVDFERGELFVEFQARPKWRTRHPEWTRPLDPPKGRKTRRVQLHPTALEALRVQRAELERRGWYREDGPVFPTYNGAWKTLPRAIDPADLRAAVERAGLRNPRGWVTHSLRHTFATLELRSGATSRAVQKRLGHASLRMLERYAHDDAADYASAIPALELTPTKGDDR